MSQGASPAGTSETGAAPPGRPELGPGGQDLEPRANLLPAVGCPEKGHGVG